MQVQSILPLPYFLPVIFVLRVDLLYAQNSKDPYGNLMTSYIDCLLPALPSFVLTMTLTFLILDLFHLTISDDCVCSIRTIATMYISSQIP